MEDLENKLDEDYVFYLGFVNSFLRRLRDSDTIHHCEQWLEKLCGEPYDGVESKRCRNIYLSQLIMAMQNGTLPPEFLVPLNEVDITNAAEVFNLSDAPEEMPNWLTDNDYRPSNTEGPKKNRTYVATRTLPDGQGAFAYIAISLAEEEPMWMGGGESVSNKNNSRGSSSRSASAASSPMGSSWFSSHLNTTGKDTSTSLHGELVKIFARRIDPTQRNKVATFYNVLLENIRAEMNMSIEPFQNQTITGLLEELEQDLRDRSLFGPLEHLHADDLRLELMTLLWERINERLNKVLEREKILDDLEELVNTSSYLEESMNVTEGGNLPSAMWEQAINKAPNEKNISKLHKNYPLQLVEKFVELLSDYKEELAVKFQKRYERIIGQMKAELQKEDDKGKRMAEEMQKSCDQAIRILKHVKEYHQKKLDAENALANKELGEPSEHKKVFQQINAAIDEQQKCVEEECCRGKTLANQINLVSEQAKATAKVNAEALKKIRDTCLQTQKNIERLNNCIQHHQQRVNLMNSQDTSSSNASP